MNLVLVTPAPAALVAIGLLAVGATVVLLATRPLSTRPAAATLVALPFVVAAAGAGWWAGGGPAPAVVALSAVAAVALLLAPLLELQEPPHVVETTALLLLGTGGAIALANAADLVQAVVGLETLALSGVTLVALSRGDQPLEAAFKYFILGGISLAGLLFGVGLVYLGTGAFAFPTAAQVSSSGLVLAGVVLVALGFAFELAIFPFHWGALDAYTAAAPGLAGFVMSASKLAAAYALGQLVVATGAPIAQLLVWVGVLTIVWGTFGALAQRNLRRMLAYSAITHAGFVALAVGAGPQGPATAAFYTTVYAAMALLVFAALAGRGTGLHAFDEVAGEGLGPVRAAALALGLFSLSGIPPTPGFWAKLAVLVVAWQQVGPLATLVAAAGGVFSVLYYLRPIPDLLAALRAPGPGGLPRAAAALPVPGILVAAIVVVTFGLFPGLAWVLAAVLPRGG